MNKINKKAMDVSPMNLIVGAAILLIVLVVVIAMFSNLFSKQAGQVEQNIDLVGDTDKDGIPNIIDKCPCICGDKDNDGCPINMEPTKPKPTTCSNTNKFCK